MRWLTGEHTAYNQVLGVVQSIKGINGLVTTGSMQRLRAHGAGGSRGWHVFPHKLSLAGRRAPSGTARFVETELRWSPIRLVPRLKYGRAIETHG
ncbi:MAG: hypothetical protein HS122_06310 [Opitutaceae bacterium]|nr:hypothetical protein [Opitutaceae bacterium]